MSSRGIISILLVVSSAVILSIVYFNEDFSNALRKLSDLMTFWDERRNDENYNLRSISSMINSVGNFSTMEINDRHVIEESTLKERNLKRSDFNALNVLLRPATLILEDFQESTTFLFTTAGISASNIKCNNLYLGDMSIDYSSQGVQSVLYDVSVPELRFQCDMNYYWSLGFFNGNGKVDVDSGKCTGSTTIMLESQGTSDRMLPNNLKSSNCNANIKLNKLEFSGTIDSVILNWSTSVLQDMLIGQINTLVCEEMEKMGTEMAESLFGLIEEELTPYFEPIEQWRLDPLYPENQLQVSADIQLANFNDASAPGVVKLSVDILDLINNHFKSTDPNSSNMGINTIIRDNVLDDNNAYVLDIADLPSNFNPVLFDVQDSLTESRVTLEKIRFMGLDSLTSFVPSTALGDRTFQALVNWKKLTAEIFFKVEMKISTAPNSILKSDIINSWVENIKLDFDLDNLEARISLLVAADEDLLEKINLGSLLTFENVLSCANSIFYDLNMSEFTASVVNINQPFFSGFNSVGMGRVAEVALEGAFNMYKESILFSIPSYFQSTIRDSITDQLVEHISSATCPGPSEMGGDKFIDFRELFLQPEDSRLIGGKGDGRYGDFISFLLDTFRSSTIADANGLSQLNANVIRPMTNFNSADGEIGGVTVFDSEMPAIDFLDQVQVTAFNLRIYNLDTVMAPVDILQPSRNPYITSNRIVFGPVEGRPFKISTRLLFNITEGGFLPPTESEVEMSVSADSLEISSVLFAMLKTSEFKKIQLGDTSDIQCWLAAFNETGLYINSTSIKPQNFTVSLKCRNCTGPGAQLFRDLEDSDEGVSGLGSMIDGDAMMEMFASSFESDEFKSFINDLVIAAPELCPHNKRYNDEVITEYNTIQDILQAMLQNMIIKPFEEIFGLFSLMGMSAGTNTDSNNDEETVVMTRKISNLNYDSRPSEKFSYSSQGGYGGAGGVRKLKGSKN